MARWLMLLLLPPTPVVHSQYVALVISGCSVRLRLLLLLLLPSGQFSFTPKTGMMFTGDYTCPSNPTGSSASSSSTLCFNPGPVPAVAAACLGDPRCRAFAYNRADGGGYFKDAGGVASPTAGSDLYQRIA